MTEGNKDSKGNYNRITLTQSLGKNPQNCKEMINLLTDLGIPFSRKEEYPQSPNSSKILRILRLRFNGKYVPQTFIQNWKRIPREFLINANNQELGILLETIMKGDGCKSSDTITEKDWNLISDYQELSLLKGNKSTIGRVGKSFQLYLSERSQDSCFKNGQI